MAAATAPPGNARREAVLSGVARTGSHRGAGSWNPRCRKQMWHPSGTSNRWSSAPAKDGGGRKVQRLVEEVTVGLLSRRRGRRPSPPWPASASRRRRPRPRERERPSAPPRRRCVEVGMLPPELVELDLPQRRSGPLVELRHDLGERRGVQFQELERQFQVAGEVPDPVDEERRRRRRRRIATPPR